MDMTTHSLHTFNLGSGTPVSVLELVSHVEAVCVSLSFGPFPRERRRNKFCTPQKAQKELKWSVTRNLRHICEDHWNFLMNQI